MVCRPANARDITTGSPIHFAEGLQGKLLIIRCTGMTTFIPGESKAGNRLVELGKQFDFMEYPNRTHGLSEGAARYCMSIHADSRYLEEHLHPAAGN